MGSEADRLVDAMEDLLERERRLLVSGSLDGLSRIAAEKEHLVLRLGRDAPVPSLERLRAASERNARLLEAAGAGVRSALRRLSDLQRGPEPLSTYSPAGERTTIGGVGGSVERRA